LTLLAQGTQPDWMLLEDANDVCDLLVWADRAVPAGRWCDDAVDRQNEQFAESFF